MAEGARIVLQEQYALFLRLRGSAMTAKIIPIHDQARLHEAYAELVAAAAAIDLKIAELERKIDLKIDELIAKREAEEEG